MNLTEKIPRLFSSFILFGLGKYMRILKTPPLPRDADGKVLIHVGCGEFNDTRYINMDTRKGKHVHVIGNIERIDRFFPTNYADLIYACHIVEHIPYDKVLRVFRKVRGRLKDGGVFRISVPNFATIVKMYQERKSVKDILPPLMGGQGYPDNFHYTAFDEKYLKTLLLEAGFRKVRRWNPKTAPYYAFNDWAGRTFPLYGKEWPISLNLEAIK